MALIRFMRLAVRLLKTETILTGHGQGFAFDAQSGRMTRLAQVAELDGGYSMKVNDPSLYNKYDCIFAQAFGNIARLKTNISNFQ